MKANELRINNWVTNCDQYCFIMEIHKNNRVELGYFKDSVGFIRSLNDDKVNPIPITEEILLKCGFNGRVDFKWNGNVGIQILNGKYYVAFKDLSNVIFHSIVEFKYLHELQNLIFALTNTELNITL